MEEGVMYAELRLPPAPGKGTLLPILLASSTPTLLPSPADPLVPFPRCRLPALEVEGLHTAVCCVAQCM